MPCALLALVLTAPLHVQAGAPLGGDGSVARPFARIADALAVAPDGAQLELEPGLYEESLTLARPVTLRGRGKTVLAAPPGAATAMTLRADAHLATLTVQGGRVGMQVERGTTTAEGVEVRGQADAAIACSAGARCVLAQVHLESTIASAVGLRGPGAIGIKDISISGPFRRAVELEGGALEGRELLVRDAVTGLHAVGARVVIREARFSGLRGSCVFASGGELELREPVFDGCEVGVESRAQARVAVMGGIFSHCTRAAMAMTESHLELRDAIVEGPSRDGALILVGGDAALRDVLLRNPGPTGVLARLARLELHGLTVLEANTDSGGDFGNALFSYDSRLSGAGLLARACQGPAVEVQVGGGRLADLEVELPASAALALEHLGSLDVDGLIARDGPDVAVACIEHGQSVLRAPWLRGFHDGPALVDCSCRVEARPPDPAFAACGPPAGPAR